ncbi:MAG: SPASM domain-containing protein [Deltaproteobacteria bacterium]|nr:SPASM domain-containing protein [Deltaproteobacteria bacterium]
MYTLDDGRVQGEGCWSKLPQFWFILFLSYHCTRQCKYCYSFNQVGFDCQNEMDERTFARLLEWIPEVWKVNNIKVNYVGFLGGEPFLFTDRIKKVMDAVFAHTDGMQGALNTNADLVDSVNWDDLLDIQWITTNITDISLNELARRMKVIAERSNAIGQTITATLDDYNLARILEVSRFGIEQGYRLRYQKDLYRGKDAEYSARLLKTYHQLCDMFEDYILRGYDVHTTFLLDALIPGWEAEDSPYPCGKRLAAVFPDGSVGPCIRDHSFKTGAIFDPDPLKIISCERFHYGVQRPGIPQECRECAARGACQGGCPHDKILLTGGVDCKSVACEIHREIVPRLLHLDELKARQPKQAK